MFLSDKQADRQKLIIIAVLCTALRSKVKTIWIHTQLLVAYMIMKFDLCIIFI